MYDDIPGMTLYQQSKLKLFGRYINSKRTNYNHVQFVRFDYIFGLTIKTLLANDGTPSVRGCVSRILCPTFSGCLSV